MQTLKFGKRKSESQEIPLVSIITPSYNQGRFIEETILSIKNQDYPDIEHIIVDGGSTDNTLEILRRYEGSYNMRWISEPDEGQADAVNKGFRMAKGGIIGWLNSDDVYVDRGVVRAVVETFQRHRYDVFYDVGAYIGAICLPVAILRRSQQPAIFAFEPYPETAQRLKENIALNDASIEVYQLAIGDRCGQAKLNVDNYDKSTYSIVRKGRNSIEVPIVTIDEFVQQGHPPPDLVKIDVEGYEMKVLLGMERTLKSNSVRHLFIEVHPYLLQASGHNEKELINWLNERGYEGVWRMVRGTEVHYQFTRGI